MKSLFSALTLIAATGCASLTEGTTQTISVKTDVPCTASRGDQTATITPEWSRLTVNKANEPIMLDCGGQVHTIESKATAAALTGALLLDFGVVDMATGAFWSYPDEVDATAQPITAAEAM